jgi:hypothetical protein
LPLVAGREEGRQHKLDSVGVQDRHDGIQSSLGSKKDALYLFAEQIEEGLHEDCQEGLGRSSQAGDKQKDPVRFDPSLTLLSMAAMRSTTIVEAREGGSSG